MAGGRDESRFNPFTAETLEVLLAIADDLDVAVSRYVAESAAALQALQYIASTRNRVLVGIALKIYASFRALTVDARARRIEAVHHLKTMVEAFVYLHVVGEDRSDTTADRLIARVVHAKARFVRFNPDYDVNGRRRAALESTLATLAARDITPLEDVGPAAEAHSPELRRWYDAVYRAACEPAHMADLFEFLPAGPVLDISAGELRTGLRHAIVALEQGLHVMVETLRFTSDNDLNLGLDVSPFAQRLESARMLIRQNGERNGTTR